ncbi:MAG: polysaccharide biosynthesis protein, partial [Desulfobacteraceae bacterium]|nr:polysaccharide biosynthesis protein [Desulfobacteraceae bacterium]
MKIRFSRNLLIIMLTDVLLILLSLYSAYQIRLDFHITKAFWNQFLWMIPSFIVIKISTFIYFDLYRGMWRYTSLNDLINIVKASIASSLLFGGWVYFRTQFVNIPRSVFIIDLSLTLIFIAGLRVFTRISFERLHEHASFKDFFISFLRSFKKGSAAAKKLLIIGAGDCGEKIYREIHDNSSIQFNVVGFLDDDPSKIGRKLHGILVIDEIGNLENVVKGYGVEHIIISLPSVNASRMRYIVELCNKSGVEFKTVPGMGELINGKVTVNAIREVEYRDLLGRQPVNLDDEKIGGYLGGRTVFVTGAGGSIGSGLCNQILRYSPEKIILFERAESSLYEIDLDLKRVFPNVEIIPFLGDITNKKELEKAFEQYKPDIIFHAAAYKHVPMLEHYPWKAVENNIEGTENLVDVADRFECEKFVFVSTDKAVNPTNIMGTSKRVSEIIVQSKNVVLNSKTTFITVRFGNVIGSVGSVIPLFKKQIKEGGPVTVTHPDIIRYFMLIPEACQLILQAGSMGRGGEIFVLEMGDPVNIDSMARDLIKFSGFEPEIDIKIEYTGLRPGEKLYEE